MRGPRSLLAIVAVALLMAGCARTAPQYAAVDPATGERLALRAPEVIQYRPPGEPPPPVVVARAPVVAPAIVPVGGPYVAPAEFAYAAQQPYTLDAGDKLRITVFGQDGLTNSYIVDASGNVAMPLIGSVPARGRTTQQLSGLIADKLRRGYIREPHVTVEVETYRPFFILGEVTNPGQYPYVANMTAETAVAIAGGFGPRAAKSTVKLTRTTPGQQFSGQVPLTFPLKPGDTVMVGERWF